jgi:hypothetical protein
MTELFPKQPDEFDDIVAQLGGVGRNLRFHEQGGYGEVDVHDEMRHMREAFEEHVKAALELAPEPGLTDNDYAIVLFHLNRIDSQQLHEVTYGRNLCIGEGAFTAYATEKGTAYENIAAGERMSGELVRFIVFPMPSISDMVRDDEENLRDEDVTFTYELGVLLRKPVLEDDMGAHPLSYEEMFVSISDPSIAYTVRLGGDPAGRA